MVTNSTPQQPELQGPAHIDRGDGLALEDVEDVPVRQAVGARQTLHGLVAAHGLNKPVVLAADDSIPRAAQGLRATRNVQVRAG